MKILVVGCGSMGRRRLRNITRIGGHTLAAFEPSADRRAVVESEFGIPTFADFAVALDWAPAAVIVSTPPNHHSEYAIAAARRGIHFFTEASVVLDGLDALIEVTRQQAIVGVPSCTQRYHPSVRLMKERIAAGAIGKVLAVTHHVGQYLPDWHPWEDYRTFYVARRETGAAREIVPYELIWLTYLFGPVTQSVGFSAKLSDLDTDIDDIYSALLTFESGTHVSMMIEVLSRPAARQARLIGEKGTLIWDWLNKSVREWTVETKTWVEYPDPPPIQGPGGEWVAENQYIDEMRGFLDAIAGIAPFPYTLEEDRAILQTLIALEYGSLDASTPAVAT